MINREDMLELTRRMTLARTSFTRIAGCYVDKDGDFDGSFNTNFLKLSSPERTKKLALAKEIKAAGAKFCDCPACAAVEAILEKKEDILK